MLQGVPTDDEPQIAVEMSRLEELRHDHDSIARRALRKVVLPARLDADRATADLPGQQYENVAAPTADLQDVSVLERVPLDELVHER